ncbi:unnamed protein product [Lactuca saligna]|uniref:Uncharacterized protein n=1 Tax=Lactuca saligna TaxID=75948 RepID=A0AA35YKP3_LACSI|nr:unnamed protein product [Lactuca saligna]
MLTEDQILNPRERVFPVLPTTTQPLFPLPTINDASPPLHTATTPIPSPAAAVRFACGAFVSCSSCIASGIISGRPDLSPVLSSPKPSRSLIDNSTFVNFNSSFVHVDSEWLDIEIGKSAFYFHGFFFKDTMDFFSRGKLDYKISGYLFPAATSAIDTSNKRQKMECQHTDHKTCCFHYLVYQYHYYSAYFIKTKSQQTN